MEVRSIVSLKVPNKKKNVSYKDNKLLCGNTGKMESELSGNHTISDAQERGREQLNYQILNYQYLVQLLTLT
ncbi:hypothetical protein BROC_01123 [Candidatus Brocadiaceae bacterium]|nr:hypothetical protein BROC_01123 [Candidatus Brocadiaceae bacterium]